MIYDKIQYNLALHQGYMGKKEKQLQQRMCERKKSISNNDWDFPNDLL